MLLLDCNFGTFAFVSSYKQKSDLKAEGLLHNLARRWSSLYIFHNLLEIGSENGQSSVLCLVGRFDRDFWCSVVTWPEDIFSLGAIFRSKADTMA